MHLFTSDCHQLPGIADTAHAVPDRTAMFEAVCGPLPKLIVVTGSACIPWNEAARRFDPAGDVRFDAPSEPPRFAPPCFSPQTAKVLGLAGAASSNGTAVKRI